MKCPECKAAGKRSTVTPNGMTTTAMYCPAYYDEDGVYHHHDRNRLTSAYSCSEGHKWVRKHMQACPAKGCDFGKSETDS